MENAAALHARARSKGASLTLYWIVRALFTPVFLVYFRMQRIGREHLPKRGPVIIASNHRSFLDPFMIACLARRPMYYVAKQELFSHRVLGWLLNALGAFPVARGRGDGEMIETAKALLARGDIVLIFCEGTRIRPGGLGQPKRGVGRLALETGAPVVPVAIFGTEAVRRGWRIRPHKVRIRAGRALAFPRVERPSPQLAVAVTDRIWPRVMLQWEWLGGLPPARRAAVIGASPAGAAAAAMLAHAGLRVDLARRPGDTHPAPPGVEEVAAAELRLAWHDVVCFAVEPDELPEAVDAHGADIPRRAGVLVVADGPVPPLGTEPAAYVAERVAAWAVGTLALKEPGVAMVQAPDRGFARQLRDALRGAGYTVEDAPAPRVTQAA